MSKEQVVTYIDGYNLYHGLLDAKLRSSRWLDLSALGKSLLKPDQDLILTRYFTTRVKGKPEKAKRQSAFIDALEARGAIEIDFGHFLSKTVKCRKCGSTWQKNEEKKTDVNIAVRLLDDAYDDRFDVAVVISGDSDLVPPIEAVRARFPDKRLLVAFPPNGTRVNSVESPTPPSPCLIERSGPAVYREPSQRWAAFLSQRRPAGCPLILASGRRERGPIFRPVR